MCVVLLTVIGAYTHTFMLPCSAVLAVSVLLMDLIMLVTDDGSFLVSRA